MSDVLDLLSRHKFKRDYTRNMYYNLNKLKAFSDEYLNNESLSKISSDIAEKNEEFRYY